MAEIPVIDLTPANPLFIVDFVMPNSYLGSQQYSVVENEPLTVAGNDILYGNRHARFVILPIAPASGARGFKAPPNVISCEHVSASVLMGDDPSISLENRVFIANDGRIVFRPDIVAAILDAVDNVGGDVKGISGLEIEAAIKPVYSNPTGETPDYQTLNAIVVLSFEDIDFSKFGAIDYIDAQPYICYSENTVDTPATIGPDPMY